MPRVALDADTADRMLSGQIDHADLPPGYGRVGELLQALACIEPPAADAAPALPDLPERRCMPVTLPARIRISSIAVATACCLAGGTAAYAAGLPQSASDTASSILAKLGVHTGSHPGNRGAKVSTVARDRTLTGAAHGAAVSAVASGARAGSGGGDASGGGNAGKGSTISKLATTTSATGVAKGALISKTASAGHSQAGQQGGGSDAGVTAPATGRAHAASSNDGHSSGGSGTTAR